LTPKTLTDVLKRAALIEEIALAQDELAASTTKIWRSSRLKLVPISTERANSSSRTPNSASSIGGRGGGSRLTRAKRHTACLAPMDRQAARARASWSAVARLRWRCSPAATAAAISILRVAAAGVGRRGHLAATAARRHGAALLRTHCNSGGDANTESRVTWPITSVIRKQDLGLLTFDLRFVRTSRLCDRNEQFWCPICAQILQHTIPRLNGLAARYPIKEGIGLDLISLSSCFQIKFSIQYPL
jgi:hypothetical protein